MTLILLLFAIGLVLLAVEVLVPGGILGLAGAAFLLVGCLVAFVEFGMKGGALALLASVALSGLTVALELLLLRKTPLARKAFLHCEITAISSDFAQEAASLIGRTGESVTMLSPSGYARIGDRSYEAFSQNGQLPAGTPLRVVGADNFRLIVSPHTTT
jgi:membrane-bound ClpP family serine protease